MNLKEVSKELIKLNGFIEDNEYSMDCVHSVLEDLIDDIRNHRILMFDDPNEEKICQILEKTIKILEI